jgi:hypothetical protein
VRGARGCALAKIPNPQATGASLVSGLEGWIVPLFLWLCAHPGRLAWHAWPARGLGLVAIIRVCVRGSWMLTSRFGGLAATSLRPCPNPGRSSSPGGPAKVLGAVRDHRHLRMGSGRVLRFQIARPGL